MPILSKFALFVGAALAGLSLPAAASTLTETSNFSSDWLNPTVVAAGTTQISGTASNLDVLQLNGLAAGAQVLNFAFSAEGVYTGGSLSAGGSILYSTTPFQWSWDQVGATSYQISYSSWNVGTPWYGHTGSLTTTASLRSTPVLPVGRFTWPSCRGASCRWPM